MEDIKRYWLHHQQLFERGMSEMTHDEKLKDLGHHAVALLNLHLQHPDRWGPREVLDALFNKFEEHELEEDQDGE